MLQVLFGGRSFPLQVSLLTVNWPDGVTVLIWSATVLGFDSVVVAGALLAPTTILPKLMFWGFIAIWLAMPTPLRAAEPALGFALSLIDSDAVRVPSAAGVKVIVTVQLAPTASVEAQPLLVIVNSAALAPLTWMLSPVTGCPASGLVILTFFAPLVAPVTP